MPRFDPSKVGFSATYKKKSLVRGDIESYVKEKITSGDVADQDQLDELLTAIQKAVEALKTVPLEVYRKSSTRLK